MALRWSHRQSTDLDFSLDQQLFDCAFPKANLQMYRAALKVIRDDSAPDTPRITAPNVGWRNISFRCYGVPISLVRSRLSHHHQDILLSPYYIANSAIYLVNPSFILKGND